MIAKLEIRSVERGICPCVLSLSRVCFCTDESGLWPIGAYTEPFKTRKPS